MKVKILISLWALCFVLPSTASDPFNTYRWNRKNFIEKNKKVEKNPWFEWWYFKMNIPDSKEAFYFIYGVTNPWDKSKSMKGTRSYVVVGEFSRRLEVEKVFPVGNFQAGYNETLVQIDDFVATDKYVKGSIEKNGKTISWDFSIEKKWAFNSTGWATGRGLTNIEWYPAQADAHCTGEITVGSETTSFQNIPCYQDRNWGNSFPKWWTWIVSNDFAGHPETTLAVGGGKPKILKKFEFLEGVTIGLKHMGREYTFRPNDLNKVSVDVSFGKWNVTAFSKRHKIKISAFAPKEDFMDLKFVGPTGEVFHDYEVLNGEVSVELYQRPRFYFQKWKKIADLYSNKAGIEYGSKDKHEFDKFFTKKQRLF